MMHHTDLPDSGLIGHFEIDAHIANPDIHYPSAAFQPIDANLTAIAAIATARGMLLYGNSAPAWAGLAHPGAAGRMLTTTATDVLWSTFALSGTAGQTYTFPAASVAIPGGGGIAGRAAEWLNATTLQAATLIKSGAGVLTLSASGAYTATIPATGTVALGADTLTVATTNNATITAHTHAITSSSNPGAAASLLASSATGCLQLTSMGIGASVPIYAQLYVAPTIGDNVAVENYTAEIYPSYRPTNNTAKNFFGLLNVVNLYDNLATGNLTGAYYGGSYRAYNRSATKTVSSLTGGHFAIRNIGSGGSYGNVTNMYVLYTDAMYDGGNTVNTYMQYVKNPSGAGTSTNVYGHYIQSITKGTTLNYATFTNAGLNHLGDQLAIVGSADRQQLIVTGYSTQAATTAVAQVTRTDAAAGAVKMLALTGLGNGADGDGVSLDLYAKSSTTAAQQQSRIYSQWYAATHASRQADLVATAWDTNEREIWRGRASGSAAMLGVLGATPVIRQLHIADAAGGANIDAEARVAINAALAVLEAFGFVAAS